MTLNQISAFLKTNGVMLIQGIIVLIVGIILIKLLNKLLKKIFFKSIVDNAIAAFIISVLNCALYILLFYLVFMMIGVSTTGFIATLTACALAVGLALQDTLSNLACGILIIFTKPFIQGDLIEVDGKVGKVKAIHLFNTQLVTMDNRNISIPNSKFINSDVINNTKKKTRRVEITVPVAYGCDIELVKKVLLQVVNEHPKTLKDLKTIARLNSYNESSLDFVLFAWCNTDDYYDVKFDLNENIYVALTKNNISIPFNQLDLHIVEDATKKAASTKKEKNDKGAD